jgi:hypothetical protein
MVMPWSEHGPGEARSFGLVRGFPSWTADGRLLAGDALSGISRIDPTGQGVRETFASAPGYIAAEVEEMASGEVVVGLRDTGREGLLELGRTRGGPVTLTGDSQILDSTGIESDAAGRGLYYGERTATGRRLYWRSLDGGQRHELENLPFAYGGIAADRGGRRLALSTCRQVFQTGRMKAGRFVPLLPPRDWSDGLIQPVGDGSFVFATDRSGPTEIWLARPGAAPRRLVAGATSPAVSRDGRLMAWVAIGDDRHRIYLGAIDGSSQRLLTDNASDDMPALSNDGSQIYFMRGSPEGMRVFRMPAEGGEPVPVTGGGVVAYSLSPADGRLAWVIDTPRGRQLALGEPGGRSQVVPALPPGNYTDVTFSADGATLWVGRGATEILELAADGRSSPKVVWHTTNDVVSHLAADEHGLLADVATYVGDIYLVEGHFR